MLPKPKKKWECAEPIVVNGAINKTPTTDKIKNTTKQECGNCFTNGEVTLPYLQYLWLSDKQIYF